MPAARIHLFPDPVLRKIAKPVERFNDPGLNVILKRLIQGMLAQPSGIGIAAPQIGISRQIAVVDVSPRVKGAQRLCLINPQILEVKGERINREGCMSVPDYTAYLKRYDWVKVTWQDLRGHWQEHAAEGIEAICIQHEIDHLNGKLFIDRVVSLKTDMIPRSTLGKKSMQAKL